LANETIPHIDDFQDFKQKYYGQGIIAEGYPFNSLGKKRGWGGMHVTKKVVNAVISTH